MWLEDGWLDDGWKRIVIEYKYCFLGHSFVNKIFASNSSLQSDVSELSFSYQELFVMR